MGEMQNDQGKMQNGGEIQGETFTYPWVSGGGIQLSKSREPAICGTPRTTKNSSSTYRDENDGFGVGREEGLVGKLLRDRGMEKYENICKIPCGYFMA